MTIATQISLIREVKFSWRRPLRQIINGAHKVLSEWFWESHEGKAHRPLWAILVWRFSLRYLPCRWWD